MRSAYSQHNLNVQFLCHGSLISTRCAFSGGGLLSNPCSGTKCDPTQNLDHHFVCAGDGDQSLEFSLIHLWDNTQLGEQEQCCLYDDWDSFEFI